MAANHLKCGLERGSSEEQAGSSGAMTSAPVPLPFSGIGRSTRPALVFLAHLRAGMYMSK